MNRARYFRDSFLVLCESFISNTQTLFNEKLKIPEITLAITVAENILFPTCAKSIKDVISTIAESRDEAMFFTSVL